MDAARSRLSNQVKEVAHLFADGRGAYGLPPPRGSLDHAINLRQEDGKPMTPP